MLFSAQTVFAVVSLASPEGWEDVTPSRNHPDVLLALHGPEQSSFVLTRLEQVDWDNRAGIQSLLKDILAGVRRKTGLEFIPRGGVQKTIYKNDLTAYLLRCDLGGRPRLVLGLARHQGMTMLATLVSWAPEVWLPRTLGAVRVTEAAPASAGRRAVSADGQLALELPEGFELEELTEKDRSKDMVLAVKGLDSEVLFVKIPASSSDPGEEAANVEHALAAMSGVERGTISPPRTMKSAAGPSLIYATASLKGPSASGGIAVGYLPWGYWGYSLFAKGPSSAEALRRCLKGLSPGPSAESRLLAATPHVAARTPSPAKVLAALGAAVLLISCLLALKGRKK